jgi:hypothetical protein
MVSRNRLDFAARQLTRAIVCEPYVGDPAEKERVAYEEFAEFNDSLVLVEKWNTPDTQEMYNRNLDVFADGKLFCELVGIKMDDGPDSDDELKETETLPTPTKMAVPSYLPVVTESVAKKEPEQATQVQVLPRENESMDDEHRETETLPTPAKKAKPNKPPVLDHM